PDCDLARRAMPRAWTRSRRDAAVLPQDAATQPRRVTRDRNARTVGRARKPVRVLRALDTLARKGHLLATRDDIMRRLTPTFVLVITCLCLFPQRADAYFWEWLDSLSGPKFRGFTVEWRAVCFTDGLRNRLLTETSDELSQAKLALEGPA